VQDVSERSRLKSEMLRGYGDAVLQAETLEDQLVKSRKHAATMQSKLDAAFAKYHNDVQEMQAKGDDLVRKNKSLRNKNKGTPLVLLSTCWRSRVSGIHPGYSCKEGRIVEDGLLVEFPCTPTRTRSVYSY
jgi:hypothetical protein